MKLITLVLVITALALSVQFSLQAVDGTVKKDSAVKPASPEEEEVTVITSHLSNKQPIVQEQHATISKFAHTADQCHQVSTDMKSCNIKAVKDCEEHCPDLAGQEPKLDEPDPLTLNFWLCAKAKCGSGRHHVDAPKACTQRKDFRKCRVNAERQCYAEMNKLYAEVDHEQCAARECECINEHIIMCGGQEKHKQECYHPKHTLHEMHHKRRR